MNTRTLISILGAIGLMAGIASSANAMTPWQAEHPRQAEVLGRLHNENARINYDVATGRMSPGRAAMLRHEGGQIRREERTMAYMNGGYLTRGEQRMLNHQENAVSRQIRY